MNQCIITTIGSVAANFAVVLLMISVSLRLRVGVSELLCGDSGSPCGEMGSIRKSSIDLVGMLFEKGPNRIQGLVLVGSAFCVFIVACMILAVIPYTGIMMSDGGGHFSIRSVQMSVGLIYIMALIPFLAYMPKFVNLFIKDDSLCVDDGLGDMAAVELAVLFAAISLFMVSGSFDLQRVIVSQGPLPWMWNIVRQPVAFVLFAIVFLLRMGREVMEDRHFLSLFTDHLHMLVASTALAVLFFGGWQIPFINSGDIVANAVPIAVVGWPLISVILCAIGAWKLFCICDGQVFGRASLIAGLPWVFVGLVLFGLFIVFGDWALPSCVPSMMFVVLQLISITVKTLLIYSAMVYVRWRLPVRCWSGMLNNAWCVILPLSVVNVLITATVLLFLTQ